MSTTTVQPQSQLQPQLQQPGAAIHRTISRNASGDLDPLTVRIIILIARHWSMRRIAQLHDITLAEVLDVARVSGFIGKTTKTQINPYWRTLEEWNGTELAVKIKKKQKQLINNSNKVRIKRPPKVKSEAYLIRQDIMTLLRKKDAENENSNGEIGITSSEFSRIYNYAIRRVSKQFLNLAIEGEIYKTDKCIRVNKKGVAYVWRLVKS